MLIGSCIDGSWAQQGLLMCLVSCGLSVALWVLAGLSRIWTLSWDKWTDNNSTEEGEREGERNRGRKLKPS